MSFTWLLIFDGNSDRKISRSIAFFHTLLYYRLSENITAYHIFLINHSSTTVITFAHTCGLAIKTTGLLSWSLKSFIEIVCNACRWVSLRKSSSSICSAWPFVFVVYRGLLSCTFYSNSKHHQQDYSNYLGIYGHYYNLFWLNFYVFFSCDVSQQQPQMVADGGLRQEKIITRSSYMLRN